MKISKIFAGMSAAAIAASLMAAIPASAEFPTEVVESEITDFTGFGAQGYVMGNATWNWKSTVTDANADGTLTAEYSYKELAEQSKGEGDTAVGNAGVQIFANGDIAKGAWITCDVDYKVVTSDGQEKTGTGKIDTSNPDTANVGVELWGYGAEWEVLDTATATVEVTFSNAVLHEKAAEPEWNTKTDVTNDTYAGDWAGDGFMYDDFTKIDTSKDMKVTIEYTLNDGFDYYLAAPVDAHGWGKLYNEKDDVQKDWIQGVTLKSSLTDEELEATEAPVLQNDGFFVLKKSGTLTFKVSGAAIEAMKENAATDPDKDTGEIWYGMGFQVYGVTINKATYEYVGEEAESEVDTIEFNEEITPDTNLSLKSSDYEATYTKAGVNLHFSKEVWNDYCTAAIKVTAGGKDKYYLLKGKSVGWDTTAEILSVDEDGDPDKVVILPLDKAAFKESKDYTKDPDAFVIPDYEMIDVAAGEDVTVNIPEIGTADDWEIKFLCYAWSADNSITMEDPDGTAKLDEIKAPLEDGTEKEEPYVFKLVSVDFTKGEVAPVEEEPEEEPGEEPEEEPEEGEEGEEEPGEEGGTEGDGDNKTPNKGTGGSNTSNPKTAAAALGLGAIALAGAAVVVSKKKD